LEEVEKYKNEADRCKNKAEKYRVEAEKYKFKLYKQKDKFRSVERKYQIALVYLWVMLMWLLVYPSYNKEFLPLRMMLQ
jgi:hypothetical protein